MADGMKKTESAQARSDLFQPAQLGPYQLANRIVMAPLTRSRAGENGVPRPLMAEYYAQRASAGLIIAEGTNVSPQGRGYAFTPGIYNDAQVKAWRQVTEAVHARGGRIFPQLWHVGRVSHPTLQPDGALPVAPSAIRPQATSYTAAGFIRCVTPRALATAEIPEIIEQYRRAARNALAAGFDGVEIHAANGYLIEQFLRDSTNKRTDAYGGSRENRARFLLGVVEAVAGVLAYIHVIEGVNSRGTHFGRLYIANPDLVERPPGRRGNLVLPRMPRIFGSAMALVMARSRIVGSTVRDGWRHYGSRLLARLHATSRLVYSRKLSQTMASRLLGTCGWNSSQSTRATPNASIPLSRHHAVSSLQRWTSR